MSTETFKHRNVRSCDYDVRTFLCLNVSVDIVETSHYPWVPSNIASRVQPCSTRELFFQMLKPPPRNTLGRYFEPLTRISNVHYALISVPPNLNVFVSSPSDKLPVGSRERRVGWPFSPAFWAANSTWARKRCGLASGIS